MRERNQPPPTRSIPAVSILSRVSFWRLLPTFLAILAIIGAVLYSLSIDTTQPRIQVVISEENEATENPLWDAGVYEAATKELLGESVLNKTKLTLRAGTIEKTLLERFPEIEKITIMTPIISRTPTIRIVPRSVALIMRTADDELFVIDTNGVAIAKAQPTSVAQEILQVSDEVGLEFSLGTKILPTETIVFMEAVARQLQHFDIDVESMALPAIANEVHVAIAGERYIGKFDITGDPRLQAGTFMAARKNLKENSIEPSEYIDARIQGRVFYK